MPVDEPIASLGNARQKPCGKAEALAHKESSRSVERLFNKQCFKAQHHHVQER